MTDENILHSAEEEKVQSIYRVCTKSPLKHAPKYSLSRQKLFDPTCMRYLEINFIESASM